MNTLRATGAPAVEAGAGEGAAPDVAADRTRADHPADVVLCIDAPDGAAALESAEVLEAALLERLSVRPRAVLPFPSEASAHGATAFPGPAHPIAAAIDAARPLGGAAVAIVAARSAGDVRCLLDLLAPVLDGRCDVVVGCYSGRRLDGAIQSGIAYPLTRALFGTPLRQPFARELALSRRAVAHLLAHGEWLDDVAGLGAEVWVASPALTRDMRVGQTWLDSRPDGPPALLGDASTLLSRTMTVLFRATERYADRWQRGERATRVETLRQASPAVGRDGIDTAPLLETFRIAARELGRIWASVLSPATSFALQRAAALPAARFGLADDVWAHAIYECALAWHLRTMPRPQLVRSMTPLYLGWLAGFAREVGDVTPDGVDQRVERLCEAFEHAKRDFIARWRWPDPFVP